MTAQRPGERVTEGDEVLISRTVCIAASITEGLELAKGDGEMAVGIKLIRSNDRAESSDVRIREADAREKAAQRRVAVRIEMLLIEAAASLIDQMRRKRRAYKRVKPCCFCDPSG